MAKLTLFVDYDNKNMPLKDACNLAKINYNSVYHMAKGYSLNKGEPLPSLQEAFNYFMDKNIKKKKPRPKYVPVYSNSRIDDPIKFDNNGMMIL